MRQKEAPGVGASELLIGVQVRAQVTAADAASTQLFKLDNPLGWDAALPLPYGLHGDPAGFGHSSAASGDLHHLIKRRFCFCMHELNLNHGLIDVNPQLIDSPCRHADNKPMVSNPLGPLIRKKLGEKKLSQKDLADHAGVTPQAVTKWLNGGNIEDDTLVLVADLIGMKPGDLFAIKMGIGAKRGTALKEPASEPRGIPVVGTTQGGPDHEWVEMGYPAGFGDEYITMTSRDPHAYALRVRGNSMSPRIREGEVILVEPTTTAEAGDDVVVRTVDGQVMVKTLVSTRNGETILDSIAKDYDRIVLRQEKIEWMHPVMGVIPARSILKRNMG